MGYGEGLDPGALEVRNLSNQPDDQQDRDVELSRFVIWETVPMLQPSNVVSGMSNVG